MISGVSLLTVRRHLLKNKLYAELKLTAVLRGRLVPRSEIGKTTDELSIRIGLHCDVSELDDAVDIEKINKLAEDFHLVTLSEIYEPRKSQIDIELRRSHA